MVCAVCLQAAGLVVRPQIAGGDPTSAEAVVEAAARYLKQYQQQLTAVLADERYRQQIINQVPRVDTMPRVRTLESEVFFMFVPGTAVADPRSSTEPHIEEIRCDSTYTNYRRFEVKVIIR